MPFITLHNSAPNPVPQKHAAAVFTVSSQEKVWVESLVIVSGATKKDSF